MSRTRRTRTEPTPLELVDGKRRRAKTCRFDFEILDNEEQKLIQQVSRKHRKHGKYAILTWSLFFQAIKISRKETKRVEVPIQTAPTFYPTKEEFADAMTYISK